MIQIFKKKYVMHTTEPLEANENKYLKQFWINRNCLNMTHYFYLDK